MKLTSKHLYAMSTEKLLYLQRVIDTFDCINTPCSECMFLCESTTDEKYCASAFVKGELESRGVT